MSEIQQSQVLPAPFIKAEAELYLDELQKAIGQYKTADLAKTFGPQFVAEQDALQKKAQQLAEAGIGGYQPFLQRAQTALGEAGTTLEGVRATQAAAAGLTGPSAYKQFMSPYQQEIIDTTLSEFDRQTQAGLPSLRNQAIQSGAFGGAREGVQEAEFLTGQARNRAALQAQLLGQAFGNAQQASGIAFGQQRQLGADIQNLASSQQNLGSSQLNLGGAQQGFLGQDVGALSTLGTQNQAQRQAELTPSQQLAQQQLNQPLTAAQQYGAGVTGLIAGYPGKTVQEVTPSPSPLQTGLTTGATLAGIYRLFNPAGKSA